MFDGSAVKGGHGYLRKTGTTEAVDDKFVQYVVEEAPIKLAPTGGRSASEKLRLLRGRILLKMACAERAAKKEKKRGGDRRVDELVRSFVDALEAEDGLMSEGDAAQADEIDHSDAEFWNGLESTGVDRFQDIPSVPEKFSRGSRHPSRISRLAGSSSGVGFGCKDGRGCVAYGCGRPAMH